MGPSFAKVAKGGLFFVNRERGTRNREQGTGNLYFCGMGRIMAIDFGRKRCGIAVTDPLKIAVNPLETVSTTNLLEYLKSYLKEEEVELIVMGMPFHADGKPMEISKDINAMAGRIRKAFPKVNIDFQDENYTSQRASKILVEAGVPKSKRREKGRLDRLSAVLILQEYLGHI